MKFKSGGSLGRIEVKHGKKKIKVLFRCLPKTKRHNKKERRNFGRHVMQEAPEGAGAIYVLCPSG